MADKIYEYKVWIRAEKWEDAHRLMELLTGSAKDGFDIPGAPTIVETDFTDSYDV